MMSSQSLVPGGSIRAVSSASFTQVFPWGLTLKCGRFRPSTPVSQSSQYSLLNTPETDSINKGRQSRRSSSIIILALLVFWLPANKYLVFTATYQSMIWMDAKIVSMIAHFSFTFDTVESHDASGLHHTYLLVATTSSTVSLAFLKRTCYFVDNLL